MVLMVALNVITDFLLNPLFIQFVVGFLFSLNLLLLSTLVLIYLERKVMAFMQDRLGPHHTGPWGLLQTVADAIKLLLKEDIWASATDSPLFVLAPVVFFAPVLAAFVVLPFSPYLTVSALNTGIIYYVALSSLDVIGVLMAGWGSNNKYSLIGGFRSAAQMISYELPLVLALVGVVMLTSAMSSNGIGSISFTEIVDKQRGFLWFFLVQPLGLFIYYVCGLAETNRAPFDLPEAESELVAGYLTEYSGMRWALFFLGEYGNMVIVSAVATALFLGGWHGPGASLRIPGALIQPMWILQPIYFIFKAYVLLLIFIWIRSTLPRLRADQLMQFAWKILIPLTLTNIVVTAGLLLAFPNPAVFLPVVGVVNWAMFLGLVFFLDRFIGISPLGRQIRLQQGEPKETAKKISGELEVGTTD